MSESLTRVPCPAKLDEVWSWWRDLMPVTRQWAYFDHAAVAPLSAPAADTLNHYTDVAATSGDVKWPEWSAKVESLRSLTAELIHCEKDEVALIPNTTAGINFVAGGYPWQSGDNVILPEGEFPSNHYPWLNLATRGVQVKIVPRRGGRVEVDDLISAIDERTKLISASWVGYASGFRIDLPQLVHRAHGRGVLVFVDAIQGMGMYPLDLRSCDVDFLSADGHKWMLGPEGAGVAVIRRRHLSLLRSENVGWASVQNAHLFAAGELELRDDAARFETGSANMPGLMAFAASLEMFVEVARRHGDDAIGQRVLERETKLRRLIAERGGTLLFENSPAPMHGSGIVTFTLQDESPVDFRSRAVQSGVVVSCRGGGVRASVHVYNDDADLLRLADLISNSP